MPTPLVDNAIVQVNVFQTFNGQRLINTLHYQYHHTGGAPDYEDAMNELLDELFTAGDLVDDIHGLQPTVATLDYLTAQPVYPDRYTAVIRDYNAVGARGGDPAPQNLAAVITKTSALAKRYGRGSWHQGGLIAADNVNGNISFGLSGLLQQIATDILAERALATLGTMTPVLWSKKVPGRVTPIKGTIVQGSIRVMRRRTIGVGK